jgi:predicted RNA-binding Zn-ribbon protein involved in translation (DUF1610 family)
MKTSTYRYRLDKSSRKFTCPKCGKRKFVRFVDCVTGDYLAEKYGRCDRESNCGYFHNPYDDSKPETITPTKQAVQKPRVNIPEMVLQKTLSGYDKNNFVQNLLKNYPREAVERVVSMYYIGTFDTYTCFPFINGFNEIRAIQCKTFGQDNHTTNTTFIHALIREAWVLEYSQQDSKVDCLFGQHLLKKHPYKAVGLVESPKNAIYGSLAFPEFLWVATYNKSTFKLEKVECLKGRDVFVFPDSDATSDWSAKAADYQNQLSNTKFIVSDFFEVNGKEQGNKGLDIADILSKPIPENAVCEDQTNLFKFDDKPKFKPIHLMTEAELIDDYLQNLWYGYPSVMNN